MSQSQNQSPTVSTFRKILRFIGIYLSGVAIIYFLGKQGFFINIKINPVLLLLCFFIVLPLVWALSKNFFAGFIKYALLLGAIILISRVSSKTDNSNASNNSSQDSFNYIGKYSAEENGIQVKIVLGPEKWYGEVIEGTTGGLISSERGKVNDKSLYDEHRLFIDELLYNKRVIKIVGWRVQMYENGFKFVRKINNV